MMKIGRTLTRRTLAGFGIAALIVAAGVAAAAPGGSVTITGKAPAATRGFPSVVVLEGGPVSDAALPEQPVRMDQVDEEFVPGVVVVRLGQKLMFDNSDALLHNVHIYDYQDDSTVINAAMPAGVDGLPHEFEKPGAYAVLCDVHPQMEAYVIVTESPFFAIAGEDGSFDITSVPAGSYTARVWNVEESRQFTRPVDVKGTSLSLDLTRR